MHRADLTSDLAYFRVKVDGPATPFTPGQYMTIGVFADGKMLQRPYSVASAPAMADTEGYELFVRHVPIVRFTTALWRLQVGHRMRMIGPKGKFMLEPDDARTHLYVSTGTGIAPFISMIRETMAQGKPRKTVLLNGCPTPTSWGTATELEEWERIRPIGSRTSRRSPAPTTRATPAGRAGRAARSRSSPTSARTSGSADKTVVYICGNPEMILNVERTLMDRGFPEFHVKKELYWPKGKAPAGAPAAG